VDLVGHRLGDYDVVAHLGGGTYGSVYRGVHPRSGMVVAIKLLHQPASERVLVEARAAAAIHHPAVVQVYDLQLASDKRPYIVMQHLDGQPLGAVMTGPLPVPRVLAIASDVLAGLGAAHALGIVHRDLKPDNIFLTAAGAVIVDFGLAKLVGDPAAPHLTITGESLGTPRYMAPEQIRGDRAIDGRADLYATGVLLYEALAGRPPFEHEALFELFDAHVSRPPPPLREIAPHVPPHVADAIMRALAKAPDDRFPDAAALRRALVAPVRRRRWPWLAGAVAALALAVGIGAFVGRTRRDPFAVPPLEATEYSLGPGYERALQQLSESLRADALPPANVRAMQCNIERVWRVLDPGSRAYYRRMRILLRTRAPDFSPDDCGKR
jgi:serine/threonine-protein kinase